MKTGVICYLKKECEVHDLEQIKMELKNAFPDADEIEVAEGSDSEEDIVSAWWHMTRRGMKRIFLRFVEIGRDMNIRVTGKEMKLCG